MAAPQGMGQTLPTSCPIADDDKVMGGIRLPIILPFERRSNLPADNVTAE
jgi:hypothetical protein